jgi:hypothetical protein
MLFSEICIYQNNTIDFYKKRWENTQAQNINELIDEYLKVEEPVNDLESESQKQTHKSKKKRSKKKHSKVKGNKIKFLDHLDIPNTPLTLKETKQNPLHERISKRKAQIIENRKKNVEAFQNLKFRSKSFKFSSLRGTITNLGSARTIGFSKKKFNSIYLNLGVPIRSIDNINMIVRLLYFKIGYFYPILFFLIGNASEILGIITKFKMVRNTKLIKYDKIIIMVKIKWVIEGLICSFLTLNFFAESPIF